MFAYGRLQPHVRVLLEHAATLEMPVVLITDTLGRKLEDDVDVTLQCGRGAPGLFASHAPTLVVEALVPPSPDRETDAEASLARLNERRSSPAGASTDRHTVTWLIAPAG